MIADARPGTRGMAMIEPIGVIAMITPWNDPMLTPAPSSSGAGQRCC